jgi:progesterone-induced-blocking factor 1
LGDYKVGKNIIENKQLLHDLQIQKIESSQKDVLLNSIKYEYESKIDSLQEKLNDALHQNNVLENRINHIIFVCFKFSVFY